MNPLISEAGRQSELGWIMGIMTVLFLGSFLGWTWWAWSARNRQAMEEAARMPLNDGEDA
jgi:cbb3-type cytochrome oxidase subunit 3